MQTQRSSTETTSPIELAVDNTISTTPAFVVYNGGGGGPPVDAETKNYLDAKVDAVKAQNDARFAEVLSKINGLHPATWQQIAAIAVGTVGLVFAVLAFSSDRFDGGLAASALIDKVTQEQTVRDNAQDEKLDQIFQAVQSLRDNISLEP